MSEAICEAGWGDPSTAGLIGWRDFHPTPQLISFAATLPLQGRVGPLNTFHLLPPRLNRAP
jgi:hypothetical protein